MTAVEALALAHASDVRVSLAGDHIRYQSRGAPPGEVIAALRAAKREILALLGRVSADATGALVGKGSNGDDLLARLAKLDFRVRRYGDQATLDDETGQGRVPEDRTLLWEFADRQREYSTALCALGAPSMWITVECLAMRRPSEAEERLRLVQWISDRFTSSPAGVCAHCGGEERSGDPFVLLFVGNDRGEVHGSCHSAWIAERESEARRALRIDP